MAPFTDVIVIDGGGGMPINRRLNLKIRNRKTNFFNLEMIKSAIEHCAKTNFIPAKFRASLMPLYALVQF